MLSMVLQTTTPMTWTLPTYFDVGLEDDPVVDRGPPARYTARFGGRVLGGVVLVDQLVLLLALVVLCGGSATFEGAAVRIAHGDGLDDKLAYLVEDPRDAEDAYLQARDDGALEHGERDLFVFDLADDGVHCK